MNGPVHRKRTPLVVVEPAEAAAWVLPGEPRRLRVAAAGAPGRLPPPRPKEAPEPPATPPAGAAAPTFFSTRYRLIRRLGEGGGGTVYKARDGVLGTDVALKFPPASVRQDHEAFDLLRREATVAMSLAHESIVKLHNLEVSGGRLFLVMEYVDGENFRQILQRLKRLSLRTVVSLTRACAAALGYAHGKGVLHRDLKPENLMLTRDQRLKIVDFGIAWPIHTGLRPETQYAEGTPGYMSPEEIRGLPLDARSDLFSLGAIVYELLSGGPVFPVGSHVDWILQITPQPPAGVPGDVAAVIMRALAREPGDRWPDVNTFAEALAQAAGPHLPAARPRRITPE